MVTISNKYLLLIYMFNYIENEAEPDIDRVSQKSWVILCGYISHYLLVRTDSVADYTPQLSAVTDLHTPWRPKELFV